jgi:tRNA-2-methylthio-N6-dimethylallyladenosine synthase
MSGRARDNRLVHFAPAGTEPRPGDVVTTAVTRAAPHYLIADGEPVAVRRTSGGDAWAARRDRADGDSAGRGDAGRGDAGGEGAGRVLLGMPALGRPA